MRNLRFLFMTLLLAINCQAYAAKPIGDLVDQPILPNAGTAQPDISFIKHAIAEGCRVKGWNPSLTSDGEFTATIYVRTHYAEVKIPFDQLRYSILYSNSRNLDYNPKKQEIHRNYNKWVILLSSAIQAELLKQPQP